MATFSEISPGIFKKTLKLSRSMGSKSIKFMFAIMGNLNLSSMLGWQLP
jgi:hypothetical protein